MTYDFDNLCWPTSKSSDALEELARRAGLLEASAGRLSPAAPRIDVEQVVNNSDALAQWVEASAEWLGLEAVRTKVLYGEVGRLLRSAGPFLIQVFEEDAAKFLAVLRGGKGKVYVLAPGGQVHKLNMARASALISKKLEAPLQAGLAELLRDAGVPPRRKSGVRSAILTDAFGAFEVGECWLLQLPPGSSFRRQLTLSHLPARFIALILAQFIHYLLLFASWWVIGSAALRGHLDMGWRLTWLLLLLTMIPFRLLVTWMQGMISIGVGGLLKQRLLYGALRFDPERIRQEGSGQLLGRVIESAAVEALAISGGFAGLAAMIELGLAGLILSRGAAGAIHLLLLAGWIGVVLLFGLRYFKRRNLWTQTRLAMTNDLVERMVGHRTRLAQQAREHWHEGEDQALSQYYDLSKLMDKSNVLLTSLIPRSWLLLGLAGLVPSVLYGDTPTTSLAVSVGGILIAYQAFGKLTGTLAQTAGAMIAWRQVGDLYHAASRPEAKADPAAMTDQGLFVGQSDRVQKLVDASELIFTYAGRAEPALRHCNLEIYTGDRLLVEGPSGGGKSTLACVLAGLRRPSSGLLLLYGLDYQTLGAAGWRRRVAAAPQFHENHVMTGTLAFNLLMGRRWPPRRDDLIEAASVCNELGLGGLLGRMPGGLQQVVGETGWQLSHGERSRLFIARALLQGADLIILDESFAALDPETLRQALHCALSRSATLLVVAHP